MFKLYDTYGFPLDLTRVIAEERGWTVDEVGFERAMDEQRKRSEFQGSGEVAVEGVFQAIAERVGATKFLGYEATAGKSKIVALVADGKEVDAVGPFSKSVAVVTAETPFYGEQGGQIGDTGTLASAGREDDRARQQAAGVDAVGSRRRGRSRASCASATRSTSPSTTSAATTSAATTRRRTSCTGRCATCSATHVTQKGSLVAPDRLRFDFSHFAPLTDEEKQRVEDLVNERVRKNVAADTAVLPIAEAKQAGAIAFFGEKYGDSVRVVTHGRVEGVLRRHARARTGDIAFFLITEEAGVAQGVRRIEAVTGAGALGFVRRLEGELGETGTPAARGQLRGRRARRQAAGRAARAAEGDREPCAASWRRRRRARSRVARRATSAACACSRRASTSPTRRRCARSPTSCATSWARA